MKIKSLLIYMALMVCKFGFSQNELNIIPKPVSANLLQGVFEINASTVVSVNSQESETSANIFNNYLRVYHGIELEISNSDDNQANSIVLGLKQGMAKEGYTLNIQPSGIRIEGDEAGVFYGLQTLKQILKPAGKGKLQVPCAEISDYPRYGWRGMLLDVGRYFMTKDSVLKFIDYLAMYKMNVFHWHLTEDQGWRIEIKKYPKLTEIGAWRSGTLIGHYTPKNQKISNVKHGGFYTQEEILEVVKYAADRHITIVPEIEMPGHAMAALASYPELSCTGGPFEVAKVWGVKEDVYCTKEETFNFLTDVLNEVMDLFPGEYIHIGGDECPKTRWKKCPVCQKRMKDLGLKDEHQLQSYFITRMEKVVNAHGKKIIGWDEILEGGLAPNAAVMSWRGMEGGITAAKQMHNVVMTPTEYCYIDYYQGKSKDEPLAIGGFLPLEKVYSFEPTPTGLSPELQKYILGGQANLWTEYVPDFKKAEYMAFPRICAMSEVLWTPQPNRNLNDFKARLRKHFGILDMLGINYSKNNIDAK
ncbi:MAG: beta-N-acetylhexosaminidase [Bacteroidales bacterium]